jgi:hypothetical protein
MLASKFEESGDWLQTRFIWLSLVHLQSFFNIVMNLWFSENFDSLKINTILRANLQRVQSAISPGVKRSKREAHLHLRLVPRSRMMEQ